MADLVVLRIPCAHCTGAVRLYFSDWQVAQPGHPDMPETQLVVWTCPACHETNHGRFPGRLELVDDGVDDEG